MGQPKVIFFRDHHNKYRWRFKAKNGDILATSQDGYSSPYDAYDAYRRLEAEISEAVFDQE
ncbi:MAG TPA: YegP family protein [Candidatus Nitrosotenuis sp.]|jgi:uncharacterized protein YegP (UPF0339 family)|nr:YegP family protein [Candidatus Nitrosotenuis sp.]